MQASDQRPQAGDPSVKRVTPRVVVKVGGSCRCATPTAVLAAGRLDSRRLRRPAAPGGVGPPAARHPPNSTITTPRCRTAARGLFPAVSCFLSLLACLSSTGCVRRALTIRSEPPGAQVFLNNHLKGETPLTYDFEWYGWYRVTLRKEGYERLDDHKPLRSPAFLWIPLDLVFELLPVEIWDRQTWSYTLVPATPLPTPSAPALTTTAPASPESAGGP